MSWKGEGGEFQRDKRLSNKISRDLTKCICSRLLLLDVEGEEVEEHSQTLTLSLAQASVELHTDEGERVFCVF